MRYGSTNHCKSPHRYTLLLIIGLIVYLTHSQSFATSLSINVYLKLNSKNPIFLLIKNFNQFLKDEKQLTPYHLKPFLSQYPLHITLYLAHYDKQQIPKIIKQTQIIAETHKAVPLSTGQFIVNVIKMRASLLGLLKTQKE
jgi:hypothetical protein